MKRTAYEASELEAARTSDVAKYFNAVVGQHDEIKGKRDKFDNPDGACYDLGKDGAFSEFKVVFGNFLSCPMPEPLKALKKKGFKVDEHNDEADFIKKLPNYDIAMFITSAGTPSKEFGEALIKFHRSGKGIWGWSDNAPYLPYVNALLEPYFGLQMTGNTPGDKQLALSDSALDPPTGHFKRHVISTGIKVLYEGATISYMVSLAAKKNKEYPYAPFKVLARSTDGQPVSCFLDHEFIDESCGRMLIDGGFTKLYYKWDGAGTARYVVNGVIWLLGLERKQGSSKGSQASSNGGFVWEWQNGSEWTPYHTDDAALLESKMQAEVESFSTKKLTFNTKHGTLYEFKLIGKMSQTNTSTSTVTKIRRRILEEVKPKKKVETKTEGSEDEAANEKPKKKAKVADVKWVWEWQQGKKWSLYNVADAEMLQEKLNLEKMSFKTRKLSFNKVHNTLYAFDLEELTQTNTETNKKTNIRRRKATADEVDYAVG